ncbi:HD-GYP domain-containing protein [Treponema brennaborense]|uniref:Metal dependent phosphohydrolase n=1 Tax=Treponema brennaborense (strain DSM 12168 / CIP 105900 / DD5/3) TaxID=906968 RepID=F4LNH7_TREBD|nr:HD domain-containing phosphohydrolase [Treponema brennaborense]AEE15831.1 putative metal dependent phosphohydrolase [Treponema brennaborense DSM 12168]
MTRKYRAGTAAFLVLLVSGFAFAADPLAGKFLSEANDRYSEGKYDKAYEYVNRTLDFYRAEEVPANVSVIAEPIYYEYLRQLRETGGEDAFAAYKVRLAEFPAVVSPRIRESVAAFDAALAKRAAVQPAAAQTAVADTVRNEVLQQQLEAERQHNAQVLQEEREQQARIMLEAIDAQSEQFRSAMEQSTTQSQSANQSVLLIVIILAAVLAVVFVIVVIIVVVNSRNTKKQQEQFAATLQMVSKMNRIPSEQLMLGNVVDIYGDAQLRSAGSSRWTKESLPEPELSEEDRLAVRELAVKCEQIGTEIDVMTGRKNNSKNISEMVYKIALNMGIGQNTAMLYFCASMVYDIGFLALGKDLLQAESLTDEQKYSIRSHVKFEPDSFDFVPERFRRVFADAAAMHHENMDGSGYPDGLKGDAIPQIARIIHVVETFVSLISRRSYREIFDKESAIAELKAHAELYDQQIVGVLDSIV